MAQNFEGFEYRPVGKTPAQQNSANRDYYGQQSGVYATGTINHDSFNEGDHPRATNGQFGKGSGGPATEPVSVKQTIRPQFVSKFLNDYTTISGQKNYIEGLPTEHLKKALQLSEGHIDPATTHVRQLIEGALKGRSAGKAANSKDTDIELLKQELNEFLTEEGQEPEHQITNLIAAQ